MMRAQDIVEVALAQAQTEQLAVVVEEASEVNLRWANSSLTTNGLVNEQHVDIVACPITAETGRTATVSGQVRDATDVVTLMDRARHAASVAAPTEDCDVLPEGQISPDWDDAPPATHPDQITGLAEGLGGLFELGRSQEISHFGYAEQRVGTTFLGTTSGTRLRFTQPASRFETTAKDSTHTRSAWYGEAGENFEEVNLDAVGAGLADRLTWQQRQVNVAPGRHTVLLAPSAVADLMIDLYWSADAESALDGRSAFAAPGGGTRVGDALGEGLTLSSNPHHSNPSMRCADFVTAVAATSTSSPFDNGVAVPASDWITNGVLQRLITTRHIAAQAELPYAPAVDNLEMRTATGHGSLADVAGRLRDGILITCLWYNRMVDPKTLLLTGLTRDGVYVVRNGEIVGSCGNYRFNESPVGLLGRILDSGATERTLAREMGDYFNRAAMPPLVVEDFNLSTQSDAT